MAAATTLGDGAAAGPQLPLPLWTERGCGHFPRGWSAAAAVSLRNSARQMLLRLGMGAAASVSPRLKQLPRPFESIVARHIFILCISPLLMSLQPTCNSAHEMDLSHLLRNSSFLLVRSKGFWRNAWRVGVDTARDDLQEMLWVRHYPLSHLLPFIPTFPQVSSSCCRSCCRLLVGGRGCRQSSSWSSCRSSSCINRNYIHRQEL